MSNTVIYLDRENFNNMGKAFNSEHKDNYKFRIQTGDIDLVFFRKEEELNKMTREEAKEKVYNHLNPSNEASANLVDALEALGLIKFDEPDIEPELDEKISLKLNRAISTKCVNDVLDMINHLGYMIVKTKAYNPK